MKSLIRGSLILFVLLAGQVRAQSPQNGSLVIAVGEYWTQKYLIAS